MTTSSTPTVAVVGAHGHGRSHVVIATDAHREGRITLAAVVDPVPVPSGLLPDATAYHSEFASLLEAAVPDVVIISTPIHTHADLALAAVRAGADVLLEKPPTATLTEFDELCAESERAGALVQVGFQSLGSHALAYIRDRVREGAVGEITRYGASAGWVRPESYWRRAAWAGRRRVGDRVVADGVLTNPLAHATATALALADRMRADDVVGMTLDLHRANDIEADDTSVARLGLRDAPSLTTAVSLCATSREEPWVEVVGTKGRIVFYYGIDVVQEHSRAGEPPVTTRHDRTALLEDLIIARRDARPLCSPLVDSGGFMRLLQGVMDAPDPAAIDPSRVRWVTDAAGRHPIVDGVEHALHEAVRTERTFREAGVEWAQA
ncbi:Gfo/Idh/MocA family protein [Micromonospora sp. DT81.3]|uniref:Gfo/Idh/MocA family protein n=1 Tax=Micromonospora sp. DT81.3 TaxID=3416523 RepID=UPI003CF1C2F5